MAPQLLLVLVYLVSGLALMTLSLPLIRGDVPRNGWYGFRVPKTLASDEVWYPANRFAGRDLYVCGKIAMVGSLVLAPLSFFVPVGVIGGAGLALTVVPLVVAIVRAFNYLRTL
jgi:uncharacterized membrane protein